MTKLVFKDIPVRTKTFVAKANIVIDTHRLFEMIDTCSSDTKFTEGLVRKTKIGQCLKENNETLILNNSIKPFRNSMTVDLFVLDKFINCKVSRNGVFQMTGCRSDRHAERCVEIIWSYYLKYISRVNSLETMFIPYMSNIDFELGFRINRDHLNKCIIHLSDSNKEYLSLFEPMRHPAVNIKFPYEGDLSLIEMRTMNVSDDKAPTFGKRYYKHYLNDLTPKKRGEKLAKKVTFLVFLSGKVIMSGGLCREKSEKVFYEFMHFVTKNRKYFELGRMKQSFFKGSIAAATVLNKRIQ